MGDFKKQNIKPYVGMALTIENQTARVVNISGGRVRLDFNHVLAGKTVEYDLEVVEIIKSDKDKIKSMVKLHYPNPRLDETKTEVSIRKGVAKITLDDTAKFDNNPYMDITFARFRIARDIWENIETITKVEFIDAFEKQIEEPEEESEEVPEKIPEVLDE
jgi:FKBP-type peptidyl-prolyl cis-trans isomerase SlyD